MKYIFTLHGLMQYVGFTAEQIQSELGCFAWLPSAERIDSVMSRQEKFTVLQLLDNGEIMQELTVERML